MVKLSLQCAFVGRAGSSFEVEIDDGAKVSKLKKAIWKEVKEKFIHNDKFRSVIASDLHLFLAKTEGAVWLSSRSDDAKKLKKGEKTTLIKVLTKEDQELEAADLLKDVLEENNMPTPQSRQIHVLVVVPDGAVGSMEIPNTILLNEPDKYAEECTSLTEWTTNAVHEIPLIWKFMSSLGGCTNNGKIFWRLEDKQVASILVDGWFRESTPDNINMHANKQSILMGSPGIGKSTLLCVMAFYLVVKHRKNVLVYRRLTGRTQSNCLLYMTYRADQILYFSIPLCEEAHAAAIYKALMRQHGLGNIWLLLDGFYYEKIPQGLATFSLLATSQQVDLKSQELDGAYCCLLPCWRKDDLFTLGRQVYNFEEEDMDGRFYISGGSVREFGRATPEDIRISIANACLKVADASILFSHRVDVQSGTKQVDRVRHTFVHDVHVAINYLSAEYWHQVVDSEFAILYLSRKIRSQDLLRVYHWARGAGHHSLAGCVFEICLHRLAADNNLILHISEYDTATSINSSEERPIDMKRFEMKKGIAQCSENATFNTQCEKELEKWRDDDQSSYWYPMCDNFPNIDSIVKMESSDAEKKSCVAYLHITIAAKHGIDSEQLEKMNKIFKVGGHESPIYVALCPSLESCKKFRLNPSAEVLAAKEVCRVYVGYYDEACLDNNAHGPGNNAPRKEYANAMSRYNLRPRKRVKYFVGL